MADSPRPPELSRRELCASETRGWARGRDSESEIKVSPPGPPRRGPPGRDSKSARRCQGRTGAGSMRLAASGRAPGLTGRPLPSAGPGLAGPPPAAARGRGPGPRLPSRQVGWTYWQSWSCTQPWPKAHLGQQAVMTAAALDSLSANGLAPEAPGSVPFRVINVVCRIPFFQVWLLIG